MEQFLENITLKQVIDFIVAVVSVFSIIAEFNKKISFKPISLILSHLGKALNKDLLAKIENIDEQNKANSNAIKELSDKVDSKFSENDKRSDEKEAKRLRASIISFADSCRIGNKHTQNHFENVFRDCSDYMEYCEKYNIPNHFVEADMKYITEVYDHCLKENKFV